MCLAGPVEVLTIAGDEPLQRTARVSFGGVVKDVSLAFLPEVEVGDFVLVHVGVALQRVDESEARVTLEYLRQMGELAEAEARDAGDS
jgi:hydrogenase expression/formation protein HypC